MTETANYGYSKPEEEDFYDISQYNQTLDAIDADMKNRETETAEHISDTTRHITSAERIAWNNKVDKVTGKALSTNDYTTTEKTKLAGIAESANNYTHPATHDASIITQNSTSRFVSDAEKQSWNGTYQQSTGYTDQKIASLINGAPETLDTLKEIADAMAENEGVVEALDAAIGTKANQTELDAHTGNSTIHITASERKNLETVGGLWARTGKNILPYTLTTLKTINTLGTWVDVSGILSTYVYNGITYTITHIDGIVSSITPAGTASESSYLWLVRTMTVNGTYTLSGCPSGGGGTTYRITSAYLVDTGSGATVTLSDTLDISITINSGITMSSKVFYPMLRYAGVDSAFEAYCPSAPELNARAYKKLNYGTSGYTYQYNCIAVNSLDLNTLTESGMYFCTTCTNAPVTGVNGWMHFITHGGNTRGVQIFYVNTGGMWKRINNSGTWGAWIEIGETTDVVLASDIAVGGTVTVDISQYRRLHAVIDTGNASYLSEIWVECKDAGSLSRGFANGFYASTTVWFTGRLLVTAVSGTNVTFTFASWQGASFTGTVKLYKLYGIK